MNPSDGFDRNVSDWLHADAEHRVPQHLDAVLRRTRTERQRPAWSSLERWLPMQSTLRFAPVSRVVWVMALVLGLVLALGATALFVGSQTPRPLPPPFGLAANGTILYSAADGDIYVLDTRTNLSRPVVTGPTVDSHPAYSPDGTKFVFIRVQPGLDPVSLVIADADGTGIKPVPELLLGIDSFDWSADGTRVVMISATGPGLSSVQVVDTRTLATTTLSLGMTVSSIEWRPDGRELVFNGERNGVFGLYAAYPDGTHQRTIATSDTEFIDPALSPDGTKVAYGNWDASRANPGILQVVDVDSGEVTTPAFDGATTGVADEAPIWSPDSSRLAFERYGGGYFHIAVAPATGGHVVETGPSGLVSTGGTDHQFSPDGTKIFTTYKVDGTTWILDASGGQGSQQLSSIEAGGTWQRLAP